MAGRVSRGQRNIDWIETFCRVPEGKDIGKPVRLRPFQKKIIRRIYNKRTRRAIISFGRKNAKTTLAGFLLLLHTCGPEARPNSQLYSAAQSRDQAAILFALASKVVMLSPDLSQFVVIGESAKRLTCPELGTVYRALSADAATNYGLSPVFVVHDELGQVRGPRSELYDALETASGAQEAPLSIVISTQAPTDSDLLSILIDDALSGADPETALFLYTAPEEDDPFTRATIRKANPAFADFLNAEEVMRLAADAKRMPAREASFRNLVLNQRINAIAPFVARAVWQACGGAVDTAAFERGPVYAGIDLSARTDLTALVYVAQDAAGVWHARAEFFAPEDGLADRAHRDRAPYDLWRDQGSLVTTPGAAVEYAWVADRLATLCGQYDVVSVKFDRWRIDVLKSALNAIGADSVPLEPHGQGFRDMGPALDTLETTLLQENLRHGGHPLLQWCAANAKATSDPAGNRKLDKAKSHGRIDGMVALAMAMAGTHAPPPRKRQSIYEQGEIA